MIICYIVPEIWRMTEVIIFHFGPFFCHFTPLTARNIKIKKKKKKWKKSLEISSVYKSVPQIKIICYTVPEIWHVRDVIVIFHFGVFFALLPPNSLKNQNFTKMKKDAWRYHQFILILYFLHKCTKNYDQMMYGS